MKRLSGVRLGRAVGVLLLLTATVNGAATVVPFSTVTPIVAMPVDLDPSTCGIVGTAVGTISPIDTLTGQFTYAGDGIQVHFTETLVYRLDLPPTNTYGPGAHITGTVVTHLAYAQHGVVTTFQNTVVDHTDVVYNSAGVAFGGSIFHLTEHFTSVNGQVIVNFDRFGIICP